MSRHPNQTTFVGKHGRPRPAAYLARFEHRFWTNVTMGGHSECWEWNLFRNTNGYGTVRFGADHGRTYLTSRVAYCLAHGILFQGIDGLCVCHTCDNPGCCNPDHLFLATDLENARDKERKGRGRQLFGSAQPIAKLSETDVIEIRRRHASGELGYKKLAKIYGMHPSSIQGIVLGKKWRRVGQVNT